MQPRRCGFARISKTGASTSPCCTEIERMPSIDRTGELLARGAAMLESIGARGLPHGDKTLWDHLVGTARILHAWSQPRDLCLAGLVHSIYGTDVFHGRLLDVARRPQLRASIGL